MDGTRQGSLFSAEVDLQLIVGDRKYRVAKSGPDYVVLRKAVDLPRCRAELVMTVDGQERRWPLFLMNGAVPFDRCVRFIRDENNGGEQAN